MTRGADQTLPEGYRIELHTQVSAPVTIGGVPRQWAILIGTAVLVVSLGLKMPYLGVPLGMALWAVCYRITKDDPYFFEAARRHLRHPSHLEG
jgi:type IV secretory pathway TrbD component